MRHKFIIIISTLFSIIAVTALAFFIHSSYPRPLQASLFFISSQNQPLLEAPEQGHSANEMSVVSEYSSLPFAELPSKKATLIAVGDIMLSRTVADKIKQHQDPNYPFALVFEWLIGADITFGNLENPITPGGRVLAGQMRFRADPGVEEALAESGFDVLSLANNHLPDYGDQGVQDTLNYLDEAGIGRVGAGMNLTEARQPVFLTRNGLTFAFLAYNDTDVVPDRYEATNERPGTAMMNVEWVVQDVAQAKTQADFVIVSMHSGHEYVPSPNASQTEFAHAAIDAGAELVIGHHPHVVQSMEKYKDKYIFYSLGNFIFDQDHSMDVRQGLGLEINFNENGVSLIDFKGVQIENYSQPRWMEKSFQDELMKRLNYPIEEDAVIGYRFGE